MVFVITLFVASITVAPFVPYSHITANLAWGDLLIGYYIILLLARHRVIIPMASLFPLLLAMLSLLSLLYWADQYNDNIPFGYIVRWFYYSILIVVIANNVNSMRNASACLHGILAGTFLTALWGWYVWYLNPHYRGDIPMLHIISDDAVYQVNRNYIGYFLSIGSSIAYGYIREHTYALRGNTYKLWIIGSFLFLGISTALTFSKGAWVSLVGSIVIFEVHAFYCLRRVSFVKTLKYMVMIVISGGLIVSSNTLNIFFSKGYEHIESSEATFSQRLDYIREATELTLMHPLLGVGPKNYKLAADQSGFWATTDPHNAVLWISSELGVFSGIIVLVMFYYLISRTTFSKTAVIFNGIRAPLSLLGLCLLLNIPIHGLPLSMKHTWIAVGIIAGVLAFSKIRIKQQQSS